MDVKLFVILFAACICRSYRNRRSLPEPFRGHLAHEYDNYKSSVEYVMPYYMEGYQNIGDPIGEGTNKNHEGEVLIYNKYVIVSMVLLCNDI